MIGTMIFVVVLMLALGAQVYMSGLQAEVSEADGQAQQLQHQHGQESLAFGFSTSGLVVVNGGAATSEVVDMYIRDPNGSVYYGPAYVTAYIPAASEAPVQGLVPAGVCQPTGTSSCLARYLDATRGSAAGYAVGLTTSLGNTFWYPSAIAAVGGNSSVYYAVMASSYFDYALASVGCGLTLAAVQATSVKVEATVGILGTGSFQTHVYLYQSKAGIPPQGSPPAGSDARVAQCFVSGSASGAVCSFDFVDSGLTAGTTYYLYLAASTTGSFAAEILGGTPVQTSLTVQVL